MAFESPSERSDVEVFKNENPLSKTRRNFPTRKKQDFSESKPRTPQKASKKIFVTKSPMIFEEEIIPKA